VNAALFGVEVIMMKIVTHLVTPSSKTLGMALLLSVLVTGRLTAQEKKQTLVGDQQANPARVERTFSIANKSGDPSKPTSRTVRNLQGWPVRIAHRLLKAPNVE